MNKIFVVVAGTFLFCARAFAQNTPPSDAGPNVMFFQSAAMGPVNVASGGVGGLFVESAANGKVITGAPYTATVSTEMTQILADGNRINNKTTASLARDSQGRTRREETMGMVGPWQVNGPKLVFINDPTSQTNYVLDPDKQTVAVLKHAGIAGFNVAGAGPTASASASGGGFKVKYLGEGPGGDQPEETKTESLGIQTMEGVAVEGKWVTRTIPAGQIGNTQPIEITSEVWTSPDLQVIVMSKHSDPRFGETTYQLTGIQRAEPDHSLFEIPPGYAVKSMPGPMGFHAGPAEGDPVPFGIVGTMGPIGK
jgi:hypothetical protein